MIPATGPRLHRHRHSESQERTLPLVSGMPQSPAAGLAVYRPFISVRKMSSLLTSTARSCLNSSFQSASTAGV